MSMFRFENPEYLNLLWLLVPFMLFFISNRITRNRRLKQFANSELLDVVADDFSKYKAFIKFSIFSLAFASLVVALANPQIGSKMEEVKREGVEIMIALDISNSMLAEDIKPNRLERAKQSLLRLVDKLAGDKLGIVVFAGQSFVQLPMTSDYAAAKLMISSISTDLIPRQGTAIGSAIDLSLKSYSENDAVGKVLLLITDGENHEDDAIGAAKNANEQSVIIHAVGMGSVDGAPIPVYKSGVRSDFIRNRSGEVVVTKLDPGILKEIASKTGGIFVRSDATDADLLSLIEQIDSMEKAEYGTKKYTDYDDKFHYFLAFALLLLLIDSLITSKKNKLFSSFAKLGE